jgi:23S rRNA pseudouridine1911/1915/1917 synthase
MYGMAEDWVEVPFEVQRPQHGLRLDAFLAGRLKRYSRAEVQRIIGEGRVFLRGRTAKASARLADGDAVLVRYPRHLEPPCPHAELPVLYEDAELLAVNKPGGVLSHPTDKIVENTATSILKRQFPALTLHLAHRLDRDTSGVLLLTKSPATARLMNESFFERKVQKEYLALVAGRPAWDRTTVDVPIGREGLEIKVRQAASDKGQAALTEFELVSRGTGRSLVSARPKTGRLHQIRVHLAHLGHPVVGDKLYTGDGALYMKMVDKKITREDIESLGAQRQMLHAHTLTLPWNGTMKMITAPLHDDFKDKLVEAGIAGV